MAYAKITPTAAAIICIFFTMTNSFSALYGVFAGRDIWLCYLLAGLLSCLVWYALLSVKEADFFGLIEKTHKKGMANALKFILLVYALLSLASSLDDFTKFVKSTSLAQTPTWVISGALVIICMYALTTTKRSFSRIVLLLTPIPLIAVVYFLSSVIGKADFASVFPIPVSAPTTFLHATFSIFINQFGRTLIIFPLIKETRAGARGYLTGSIISTVVLTLISLITVSTLGPSAVMREQNPTFTLLSIPSAGGFIRHMEILTSMAGVFFIFVRVSLALNFIKDVLKEKNKIYYILALFSIPLSLLITSATVETVYSIALIFPLQFILPVFLSNRKRTPRIKC